jgi:hypothetical protein
MTSATVLHEFAHVLAGVTHGHDAVFRRAHVDLVGFALGDEPATWLLEAYAAIDLEPGRRAWSPPSIRHAAGGPVAL